MAFNFSPFGTFQNLPAEYKDDRRFYKAPNGELYPSVTTVLGHEGKEAIERWKQRVGKEEADKITRMATSRGQQLHESVESYLMDADNFDPSCLNPVIKALFVHLKEFLDQSVEVIHHMETCLYSDAIKTAGRVDLVCQINGKPHIVDFKTSKSDKEEKWMGNYFAQASAYAIMLYERTGILAKDIIITVSPTESNYVQIFHEESNKYFDVFLRARKKFLTEVGI